MQAIIVGYGLAGSVFHAPLLQSAGFEIAAIVVRNPERRAQAAASHPHALICDDLTQALSQTTADLVTLASPTATHAPLAIEALHAGRHVVIDKPFTVDAHEAEVVIAAAHAANKLVIPFQNRRWDADFLSLKELIHTGQLGDIVRYEARFDRFNPTVKDRWREHNVAGGGMLYDLGPHLIDQALHLFGAPEWVFCTQLTQRDGAQTDDAFELILGSSDCNYPYISLGASMFSAAGDSPQGAPRFKVNGRRATWLKSGFDPQETELRKGIIPNEHAWVSEIEAARGHLIDGVTGQVSRTAAGIGQWPIFYTQVKSAIEGKTIAPVLATQALLTCKVIDAAQKSAHSGQRVHVL
ncbi:scyllo-inositol 2-dehydrogenase (NADP(+)) [Ephemeroptericola cinctiostellae]|uniref:Scyllo-inositol 2-dehydrogenase (NADP(+)) n=1 Tax=Ephemeroptericola cinctiostellae TaxID=2268024 RepID=A0A345DAR9_9BURK|nr:Gfo/Idh/MocA family oxidoreductase [Ephemeroptericola cinctiostellae]AXF85457.1 scyllo-inositol 2-dehydrogenase (NADP(+)) [Ephemeroptericola cinctiostellae]